MRTLVVQGGRPLRGELHIHGAKNSILPILSACILSSERNVITRCPKLSDVTAAMADEEIKTLLARCYENACKVLRENRGLLDEIALFLLQKETITGDEFMAYVNADKKRLEAPAEDPETEE